MTGHTEGAVGRLWLIAPSELAGWDDVSETDGDHSVRVITSTRQLAGAAIDPARDMWRYVPGWTTNPDLVDVHRHVAAAIARSGHGPLVPGRRVSAGTAWVLPRWVAGVAVVACLACWAFVLYLIATAGGAR